MIDGEGVRIDVSFNVSSDTPAGKDPDTFSPTLARYHEALWNKPLPTGDSWTLVAAKRPPFYLSANTSAGETWLSSDAVIHTYTRWPRLRHIIDLIPEADNEEFRSIASTIGATMVWPAAPINRKWTINQARGCLRPIDDRFDLTLECVRRHYVGEPSPLGAVLGRYRDYFALFADFVGFVDFFLLHDLVSDNSMVVRFFLPFDEFATPGAPRTLAEYLVYRSKATAFIEARNARIAPTSQPSTAPVPM